MKNVYWSDQYSIGQVWYAVGLLTVVNVFNFMDRMALAVLAPAIKVDLKLSDAQLGLLVGFAFAVFYASCGIPIARWADRGNRRNIIALSLATWSVMTALSGAAQTFWQLCLARVGVGAGEGGGLAPAQSLICDYVPLNRRSGFLAIHGGGSAIGVLAGMALAGWLAEVVGWRWAFVVLGAPGLVLALAVRSTLHEPERGSKDALKNAVQQSLPSTIRILWRCRTYRLLVLFWAVMGFVQYGLIQWLPSFYSRSFALDLSAIGRNLGVAIGLGQGAGVLIGGLVADKLILRDVRLPLVSGALAIAAVLPIAVGALFSSSATTSILLVFVAQALNGVSSGPIMAAQYSVVSSCMRATAGSIVIFFSSVVGLGVGSYCVGMLSDTLEPAVGVESLRYALLMPVCLIPAMVMALIAATRTLPADLKASADFEERVLMENSIRAARFK